MTIMDCRPFLAVGVSFLAAILISFVAAIPTCVKAGALSLLL